MSKNDLLKALEDYKEKVNSSDQIQRMIHGWEPYLLLNSTDRGDSYFIKFENSIIKDIHVGRPKNSEHLVEIDGCYQELLDIFTGKNNPAQSFLKGNISVFASEKDQVKLDAIALVLWGF